MHKGKKKAELSSAQVQQGGMKRGETNSPASRGDIGIAKAAIKKNMTNCGA